MNVHVFFFLFVPKGVMLLVRMKHIIKKKYWKRDMYMLGKIYFISIGIACNVNQCKFFRKSIN